MDDREINEDLQNDNEINQQGHQSLYLNPNQNHADNWVLEEDLESDNLVDKQSPHIYCHVT